MNELKPCPFCGSGRTDPTFSRGYKAGDQPKPAVASGCWDCGAVGPDVLVPEHSSGHLLAVKAWNSRTESDELAAAKARIAELEKALEPFADTFNRHDGMLPTGIELVAITIGDLRRASALVNKEDA